MPDSLVWLEGGYSSDRRHLLSFQLIGHLSGGGWTAQVGSCYRSGSSCNRSGGASYRSGNHSYRSGRKHYRSGSHSDRSGRELYRSGPSSNRSGNAPHRSGPYLYPLRKRVRYRNFNYFHREHTTPF